MTGRTTGRSDRDAGAGSEVAVQEFRVCRKIELAVTGEPDHDHLLGRVVGHARSGGRNRVCGLGSRHDALGTGEQHARGERVVLSDGGALDQAQLDGVAQRRRIPW